MSRRPGGFAFGQAWHEFPSSVRRRGPLLVHNIANPNADSTSFQERVQRFCAATGCRREARIRTESYNPNPPITQETSLSFEPAGSPLPFGTLQRRSAAISPNYLAGGMPPARACLSLSAKGEPGLGANSGCSITAGGKTGEATGGGCAGKGGAGSRTGDSIDTE